MKKKKFAFLLMGTMFDPAIHQAAFETEKQISYIYTVRNLAEAIEQAKACQEAGVGIIELCGAFEESGAKKIIEATGGTIGVGYVTHQETQDQLFNTFFA